MSIVVESDEAVFITGTVHLLDDDKDVASDWASPFIKTNKNIKWMVGKYVEADNANNNQQYWTLKDLQSNHHTVDNSPINMGHRPADIVGTVVASDVIYPERQDINPYVETVGAFWKWYRPDALAKIEEAFAHGTLFQSMETTSESITCVGPDGCGETFAYAGPRSKTYCDCINEARGYKQLNNPHFLGAGLIIPPDKPGWTNAEINSIAAETTDEQKQQILASVASTVPHLSPPEWEKIMWTVQFEAFANRTQSNVTNLSDYKSASAIAKEVSSRFMAKSWL